MNPDGLIGLGQAIGDALDTTWVCPSCETRWPEKPLVDGTIGCPECGNVDAAALDPDPTLAALLLERRKVDGLRQVIRDYIVAIGRAPGNRDEDEIDRTSQALVNAAVEPDPARGPGCPRHLGDPHNLCQACWALEPDPPA